MRRAVPGGPPQACRRRRACGACRLTVAALAALCLGACSSVVPSEERPVAQGSTDLEWRPAAARDLGGLWESTEVEGASAGAVLKAYYWLDPAGEYSGAALVVGAARPRLVVLAEDGRWTLGAEGLDLHDGSGPCRALWAAGHLRLVTEESAITFRRVPID